MTRLVATEDADADLAEILDYLRANWGQILRV